MFLGIIPCTYKYEHEYLYVPYYYNTIIQFVIFMDIFAKLHVMQYGVMMIC